MWLSDRRTFLLSALGALTACGFEPVYDTGQPGNSLLNAVLVDAPREYADYLLVENLEQRLGRTSDPRFGLSYKIELQTDNSAIAKSNITLRYNQLATITYALRDLQTKQVLTTGTVSSFTSYSGTGTSVANTAAERDATRRLMQILSDQILTRLAATAALPRAQP